MTVQTQFSLPINGLFLRSLSIQHCAIRQNIYEFTHQHQQMPHFSNTTVNSQLQFTHVYCYDNFNDNMTSLQFGMHWPVLKTMLVPVGWSDSYEKNTMHNTILIQHANIYLNWATKRTKNGKLTHVVYEENTWNVYSVADVEFINLTRQIQS
jgi:hypothetical protein